MSNAEMEYRINQAYEAYLDRAWEAYNQEGNPEEEEYDAYARADEMYAMMKEEQ